ncbi:uncharacterized protein BN753_01412 [Clostridium sp. CAG:678]|nr:uncharacterized protein BN753_01412 [Clostridium sp. CAG:678]
MQPFYTSCFQTDAKNAEVRYVKPLKEKISITIDEDILAEIKRLAEADDRSLSQYINMVLKKHLNQ